jgi:hypothetical protein
MEFEQASAKMLQFDREEAERKSKVKGMLAKVRSRLRLK